jgi:hypothetical protein
LKKSKECSRMTSIWDGGVIVDNGGTREFVVVYNNEFV